MLGHSNTPLVRCLLMTMLAPPAEQEKLGCEDAPGQRKGQVGGSGKCENENFCLPFSSSSEVFKIHMYKAEQAGICFLCGHS